MKKLFIPLAMLCIFSCGNPDSNGESTTTTTTPAEISETRETVKEEPVATYDVPLTGDEAKLNKWHFTVQLFETKERFRYRVEMQYEEMTGSDTITFPNLRQEPQPQIQKGESNLDAIIGFLDNEGTFRNYILVSGKDGQLNMKTIQRYAVTEK
jgi:hypothetical protein